MSHTIFLVEDNAQNRYLTTFLLERNGYSVVAVADGALALSVVETLHPACVLLDIQLPIMDGYTVARRLRELEALKHTPIIAVTSYAMPGDREKALESGCTGYIEKPIDPETFVAEVERLAGFPPSTSRHS